MALDILNQNNTDPNTQPTGGTPAPTDPGSANNTGGVVPSNGIQAAAPSATSGNASSSPSSPVQKGTGYTNIQRVLDANQGNNLGQTVAGGITGQVSDFNNNLNQGVSDFNTASTAGQLNYDPSKYSSILNDATNSVNNQSNIDYVQNALGGGYTGPTNLENSSYLANQANNLQNLGQINGGSAAGVQALLQMYAGGPNYTSGEQSLDGLLLGTQGASDLKNATAQTRGLVNQQQTADQQAASQAAQYQQQAAADNTSAGLQLYNPNAPIAGTTSAPTDPSTNVNPGLLNTLNNNAINNVTNNQSSYSALQSALQNGQLTQDQVNSLGLGGALINNQNLYGAQLQNYLNPQSYTNANSISSGDYAKMQALQTLAGNNLPVGASSITDQYNSTDAGTQANAPQSFQTGAFQQALGADKNAYIQAALAAINQIGGNPANPGTTDQQLANYENNGSNIYNQQTGTFNPNAFTLGGVPQTNYQQALNAINAQYGIFNPLTITPSADTPAPMNPGKQVRK